MGGGGLASGPGRDRKIREGRGYREPDRTVQTRIVVDRRADPDNDPIMERAHPNPHPSSDEPLAVRSRQQLDPPVGHAHALPAAQAHLHAAPACNLGVERLRIGERDEGVSEGRVGRYGLAQKGGAGVVAHREGGLSPTWFTASRTPPATTQRIRTNCIS